MDELLDNVEAYLQGRNDSGEASPALRRTDSLAAWVFEERERWFRGC
jgi:hypothetical protein